MRRTIALLVLATIVLAGAACGDDDGVDTGSPPSGGGDPTDVVLRIEVGGGFVPFGYDFAGVPTLVLRDGTVFTGGAVAAIFPGPAVSPVSTGTISAADLRALLEAAVEAGLTEEELDVGEPGITDVPTTTITVEIDGVEHTHAIYALDVGDLGQEGMLTEDQVDQRRRLSDFVTAVSDSVSTAAADLFEPTAYQVVASPIDRAGDDEQDVVPNELAWPFADLPLPQPEGECYDIDGDRVAPFEALLAQATQITIWTDASGSTFQLGTRATLPGDEPC